MFPALIQEHFASLATITELQTVVSAAAWFHSAVSYTLRPPRGEKWNHSFTVSLQRLMQTNVALLPGDSLPPLKFCLKLFSISYCQQMP